MREAPKPLVPADSDLRDYPYTPIFRARLFNSSFHAHASDAEWRAGFTLLLKAQDQIPAGSLPNDDRELRALAEAGSAQRWQKIKARALHGWMICKEDNRLYHSVLAEAMASARKAKRKIRAKIDRRLEIESGFWSDIRMAVYKRDRFTCQYCGVVGKPLECDHVHPVSRGGKTVMENLATACRTCNRAKGSKTLAEWRQ